MKQIDGQIEMPLPTSNRPKWQLRAYLESKEEVYGTFDTESEAEVAKGVFTRYSPGVKFRIVPVK